MATLAARLYSAQSIKPRHLGWHDGYPLIELRPDIVVPVRKLLGPGDTNPKLAKSAGRGFDTVGLSLSPHKSGMLGNLCGHASRGCVSACLDHQGHGAIFQSIHDQRVAKTAAFKLCRRWFLDHLKCELSSAVRRADQRDHDLCCRLNVFSDLPWERLAPSLFREFPNVQFYDYTKHPKHVGQLGPNYWVTFSRSETNQEDCLRILAAGGNVAVVFARNPFRDKYHKSLCPLPASWRGYRVIDGDETDLRFLDPRGRKRGVVVGLRLKAANNDEIRGAIDSGFAIRHRGDNV